MQLLRHGGRRGHTVRSLVGLRLSYLRVVAKLGIIEVPHAESSLPVGGSYRIAEASMYLDDFTWLPDILDKIAVKHHVTQDEVEEIFFNAPQQTQPNDPSPITNVPVAENVGEQSSTDAYDDLNSLGFSATPMLLFGDSSFGSVCSPVPFCRGWI
jgi:hypothetical protein